MAKVRVASRHEVDESVIHHLLSGKARRKAAFEELRASFAALREGTGKDITSFRLPAGWCVRGVESGEQLVHLPGRGWCISGPLGEEVRPCLPPGASAKALCIVVFTKDQGSVGIAGSINMQRLGYLTWTKWDFFHRLKNDTMLACKRAQRGAVFRALLEVSMVMNLNYNPYGTGEWFGLKQEALQDLLETRDATCPEFVMWSWWTRSLPTLGCHATRESSGRRCGRS